MGSRERLEDFNGILLAVNIFFAVVVGIVFAFAVQNFFAFFLAIPLSFVAYFNFLAIDVWISNGHNIALIAEMIEEKLEEKN